LGRLFSTADETDLHRLRESFVGDDEHASVEEVRSNLLVHHVDVSLIAGVEVKRIEPAGALDQQVEVFGAWQRVFDHVEQVRRRVLRKVLHRRWNTTKHCRQTPDNIWQRNSFSLLAFQRQICTYCTKFFGIPEYINYCALWRSILQILLLTYLLTYLLNM